MERKERGIPAACMSSRERRSSLEMGSMGCKILSKISLFLQRVKPLHQLIETGSIH